MDAYVLLLEDLLGFVPLQALLLHSDNQRVLEVHRAYLDSSHPKLVGCLPT